MAKIVHLTSVATTLHVRIFAKQCRSLAAAGNDVVLLCTHTHNEVIDGVTIKTVGKPRSRLARMLGTTRKIFAAALREDADLYVAHDPELMPVAWLLSKLGRAAVYDMHEYTPGQLLAKHWVPRVLRRSASWSMRLLQRLMLGRLPVVFAESSYAKHYPYVRRSATVLNMPFRGEAAPRFGRPTVGYIGGVAPLRGSTVTIEALELLAAVGRAVDFECIGPAEPTHAAELRRRGHALRPADIRVRGYEPSGSGWRRIARCHAGLAVLSPVPNYYESFPGKMFEYMSFGVPVIVSDFPLYREVVDQTGCGLCVDPRSPRAVADAIAWLIDNPEGAAAMGRRGKEAVDGRWNWGVEFEALLSFYDALLAPRGVRVCRGGVEQLPAAAA
ncbi:MAG: glycosyltransferase [Planctomycetota bacterium]